MYIYDFTSAVAAFERHRSTLSKLEWLTWVTLWNSMKFIRRSRAPGWVDAATVCCLIWDVILENVCLISLYRSMGVFASVSRQWCIKTVRLGRWTALRCLSSLKPSGGESVWVTASSCAPALETSTNMMASKTLWAKIQNAFNKSRSICSILHCFVTCFKFSALFLCTGPWEDLRVLQSQLQSGAGWERYVCEGLELGHC